MESRNNAELIRNYWEGELAAAQRKVDVASRQLAKIINPGQTRIMIIECADEDRFAILDEPVNNVVQLRPQTEQLPPVA